MTTIINNPNGSESSGTGVVVGILVALLIVILVVIFGLPYLRNRGMTESPSGANVDVNIPLGNGQTQGQPAY